MPVTVLSSQTIGYNVYGNGDHAVLVIPGAIGTAKSDFQIQFDPSNQDCLDFDKFTFVCVELSGWGRSRPPKRNYGPNVLEHDVECCVQLMQRLGFEEYSVIGWSEGARVAMIMGRKFGTTHVKCIVLQSVITYSSEIGTKHFMWSRNIHNWTPEILDKFVKAYDDDVNLVSKLWNAHMDYIAKFSELFPAGLLGPVQTGMMKLMCPTLLLQGSKDFFVENAQAEHVAKHVPNCKLIMFPKGAHNLHQTEPDRYKQIVEQFLNENS